MLDLFSKIEIHNRINNDTKSYKQPHKDALRVRPQRAQFAFPDEYKRYHNNDRQKLYQEYEASQQQDRGCDSGLVMGGLTIRQRPVIDAGDGQAWEVDDGEEGDVNDEGGNVDEAGEEAGEGVDDDMDVDMDVDMED